MCQKCVCGRGSAPNPAGGAYSASPDPKLDLRGPTSKRRGGHIGSEEMRGKERGRERKGAGVEKGRGKGKGREIVIPVLRALCMSTYRVLAGNCRFALSAV